MEKKDKNLKVTLEFDGFKISKPLEISFHFNRKDGYELFMMKFDPMLIIKDSNCDGKAETFQLVFKEIYKRGQEGTEKIFQKADELLARYMEELEVEKVRKEWEEKLGKYNTKEEYYSDIIKDL